MKATSLEAITTDLAPAPVGPYNQTIKAGDWLFCSGQIALNPSNALLVGQGDITKETRQVLDNLISVLNAAGAKSSQVVKTTIYLIDLGDFEIVNAIYSEIFGEMISPARACVQVAALPKGGRIEIDCIAWMG